MLPAGIDACYVVEPDKALGTGPKVQTDGLNFAAAWANGDLIDLYNVTVNDVSAVLNTFGVEAARASIVHEIGSVFGAYGIAVNARHVSLVADFMTCQVSVGSTAWQSWSHWSISSK